MADQAGQPRDEASLIQQFCELASVSPQQVKLLAHSSHVPMAYIIIAGSSILRNL